METSEEGPGPSPPEGRLLGVRQWKGSSERLAQRLAPLSVNLTMGMQGGRSVPWIPLAVQPSEREMWTPFT